MNFLKSQVEIDKLGEDQTKWFLNKIFINLSTYIYIIKLFCSNSQ
jgi:hypothetical protein